MKKVKLTALDEANALRHVHRKYCGLPVPGVAVGGGVHLDVCSEEGPGWTQWMADVEAVDGGYEYPADDELCEKLKNEQNPGSVGLTVAMLQKLKAAVGS